MSKYNNTKELAKAEGIKLDHKPMSTEQSEVFIQLTMMGKEARIEAIDKMRTTQSICNLAIKRIESLNLPIDLDVCFLIDIFAEGVPGRAVFMIIDLMNYYEDNLKEVNMKADWDVAVTEIYPWGFYSNETIVNIVDNYVKTNKLRNSEIY